MSMGGIIEEIKSFITDLEKRYWENAQKRPEHDRRQQKTLKSKTASRDFKLINTLVIQIENHEAMNIASNLVILNSLLATAVLTEHLENSVITLENQLIKSNFMEKCKYIDDIKKLKAILTSQRDAREKELEKIRKDIEETRKQDLSYID